MHIECVCVCMSYSTRSIYMRILVVRDSLLMEVVFFQMLVMNVGL